MIFYQKSLPFRTPFIVCTPRLCKREGEGGLSLQPKFQKGGDLAGPHLLEGGCWEIGSDFFQVGVAIFTEKIN